MLGWIGNLFLRENLQPLFPQDDREILVIAKVLQRVKEALVPVFQETGTTHFHHHGNFLVLILGGVFRFDFFEIFLNERRQ